MGGYIPTAVGVAPAHSTTAGCYQVENLQAILGSASFGFARVFLREDALT